MNHSQRFTGWLEYIGLRRVLVLVLGTTHPLLSFLCALELVRTLARQGPPMQEPTENPHFIVMPNTTGVWSGSYVSDYRRSCTAAGECRAHRGRGSRGTRRSLLTR